VRGRVLAGVAILLAWVGGLGMLVRREYFRPHVDRLAEAALRVTPGAVFYAVMQGDKQVGFASSTIDTTMAGIEQRDYLVADIPVGGQLHRATARTNVLLTRTLRVKSFDIAVESGEAPVYVAGEIIGDTLLQFAVRTDESAQPDTQRLRLSGPILLPTQVPLAVALQDEPRVGNSYLLPLFDPTSMGPKDVRIDVRAESTFVVNDSSVFDSTAGQWRGVLPINVRAWQITSEDGAGLGGWVDEQGRLVATSQMGFQLQRRPYEVAFENWRRETDARASRGPMSVAADRDILETTAIAANKRLRSSLSELRVRLGGVSFNRFHLRGGRQTFRGDTLRVVREQADALVPRYLRVLPQYRSRYPDLKPEVFLEVNHPEIVALAERLADGSNDPRVVAQRINQWVHDSVRKEVTIGIPSALHVLHTRTGDCNEHAQLFTALARAAGIPARIASGLAYVDGKFYYHAWPEVMLRGWVAVDPTFGQFPADAAHLRFVTGGLGQQAELLRLVGRLTIDVLGTR
jgi:hypothetical protein